MIKRVALARDVPEYGLARGDLGTVVHIYEGARAFEVEFMTFTGDTIGVVTLEAGDVRPITEREIAHARHVAWQIPRTPRNCAPPLPQPLGSPRNLPQSGA